MGHYVLIADKVNGQAVENGRKLANIVIGRSKFFSTLSTNISFCYSKEPQLTRSLEH